MTTVAGYRLAELRATGGMSEVWLGIGVDGERAAVKLLDPDLSARPAMRARLDAAFPLLRGFRHDAAASLLDAGEHAGRRFAIVEWVEGSNLRPRARNGLRPQDVSAIVARVAEAIDALDLAGITYADVKTGNVLMTDGGAVLSHSWLAFPRGGDAAAFTEPDRFAGTIDYVAPEVIGGALPDLRADVYGLACTAFECLTGRVPFPRGSEEETLDAHLHAPPPETGTPSVDRVLARALAKAPRDRHATAGSFAADLTAATMAD